MKSSIFFFAGGPEQLPGKLLLWLCESSQSPSGNSPRSYSEEQGDMLPWGIRSLGPDTYMCVWGGVKGTHSWDAHGGGQKEKKSRSFSGKNAHPVECGNVTSYSSSLCKWSTPVKFHWIQCSCTSREITVHLHPNTNSESTLCAFGDSASCGTSCVSQGKQNPRYKNTHHSGTRNTKRYQEVGFTGFIFNLF